MATKAVKPHRPQMRPGTQIKFWRSHKDKATLIVGKVVGTDDKKNGRWIAVNIAAARMNPVVVNIRESQIIKE